MLSAAAVAWCIAEPTPPWGASALPVHRFPSAADHPVPPASREEARALRDALTRLITRERQAAADFLLALADFDRRCGWSALGHRSLFDFLKRELRCSSGAASHRCAAARLIPRFPAVEAALRAGELCLSSLHHLARVLRPENEADYLPRFFGLSAREAEALAAELAPRAVQPRRELVTLLAQAEAVHTCEQKRPEGVPGQASLAPLALGLASSSTEAATLAFGPAPAEAVNSSTDDSPTRPVQTCERPPAAARPAAPAATQVEPLSGELRRLHLTVSTRLLGKLESARAGQAHITPSATTEQVLEAALDLLLERQARRKGLVKRPRSSAGTTVGQPLRTVSGRPSSTPAGTAIGTRATGPTSELAGAPNGAADGPADLRVAARVASPPTDPAEVPAAGPFRGLAAARTRHIPAAVRCEVWLRDGQRCQHPLDSGGRCGATHWLELDHVVPMALGGLSTAGNLRVVCRFHNQAAARGALGNAIMEDQRARARRGR